MRQRVRPAARPQRRVHRRGAHLGDRALPVLRRRRRVDPAHAGAEGRAGRHPRRRRDRARSPRCRCSSAPDRRALIRPGDRPALAARGGSSHFRHSSPTRRPRRRSGLLPWVRRAAGVEREGWSRDAQQTAPARDRRPLAPHDGALAGRHGDRVPGGELPHRQRRAVRHARLRRRRADHDCPSRTSPTPTTSTATCAWSTRRSPARSAPTGSPSATSAPTAASWSATCPSPCSATR